MHSHVCVCACACLLCLCVCVHIVVVCMCCIVMYCIVVCIVLCMYVMYYPYVICTVHITSLVSLCMRVLSCASCLVVEILLSTSKLYLFESAKSRHIYNYHVCACVCLERVTKY